MAGHTSILVRWMIFRLLFFDRAVVIDENEGTLVVWIYVAGSPFVSGTKVALQSRIVSRIDFVGMLNWL